MFVTGDYANTHGFVTRLSIQTSSSCSPFLLGYATILLKVSKQPEVIYGPVSSLIYSSNTRRHACTVSLYTRQ
eukprot:g40919.t1